MTRNKTMEEKKVPNENNDARGYCRRCFVVIVFMRRKNTMSNFKLLPRIEEESCPLFR